MKVSVFIGRLSRLANGEGLGVRFRVHRCLDRYPPSCLALRLLRLVVNVDLMRLGGTSTLPRDERTRCSKWTRRGCVRGSPRSRPILPAPSLPRLVATVDLMRFGGTSTMALDEGTGCSGWRRRGFLTS